MATQSVTALPLAVSDALENPDLLLGEARVTAWVERLSRSLDNRSAAISLYRAYFAGDHPLAFATAKWQETFGDTFGQIVDNWGAKVITSSTERMLIEGFRRSDSKDEPADGGASAIWRRCNLKVGAQVAHTNMLVTAYSYVSVGKGKHGKALVRVEDPANTIVEHDPETGVDRLAALKRWRAVDGTVYATLYLPEGAVRLVRGATGAEWKAQTGIQPYSNGVNVVPVLEMVNEPDEYGFGKSDLASMMSLGDAVEKLLGDMMIASEFAAFKQRVLMGAEVPINPETGKPDQSLVGGINRWLAIEDENVSIEELSAADLSNYTGPIELLVQHIAALTSTPPHYLLGSMVNVSGDALAAAESGLVSKVRRRIDLVDGAWSEAMSIALQIDGFGSGVLLDPVWKDPERVSNAALSDALQKQRTLGVPLEAIFEQLTTPDNVGRWMEMAEREAQLEGIMAGISGPSGTAVQPGGDPTLTE